MPAIAINPHSDRVGIGVVVMGGGGGVQSTSPHVYGGPPETDMPSTASSAATYAISSH